MKNYTQKDYLIQRIHNAFEGVVLGKGVSLHETEVIDRYGSTSACQAARAQDEKQDWKKLLESSALETIHGIGGPSFFDAEGMRFHLPAYMILSIQKPEEEVVESFLFQLYHLSEYQRSRFNILTPKQKRCVAAFLQYIRHNGGRSFEFNHAKIDSALTNYWKICNISKSHP